jgi:glycosyltransferase 2 family protein
MRRLAALLISVTLLGFIYWRVDISNLFAAVRAADWSLLTGALLLLVPLTFATAWRFSVLVGHKTVGVLEATRMILFASTLNLFLPSKMGDIAKAALLVDRHGMDLKFAVSISIFDKVLDVVSMLILGVGAILWIMPDAGQVIWISSIFASGLLLLLLVLVLPLGLIGTTCNVVARVAPVRISNSIIPLADTWQTVVARFWKNWKRASAVISISLITWCGHLLQFWLLAYSLGGQVPIIQNMAYASLSILVGLIPVTIAGIGSRDAALIYFYSGYLTPGQGAFLGVLATLRYVLPALAGLPFVAHFVHTLRGTGGIGQLRSRMARSGNPD